MQAPESPAPIRRSATTLGLYGALGCLGYLLAGLGVILPDLRVEHGLPRGEAALYPAAFAFGLLLVGVAGEPTARRLGRFAMPAALACLASGAALLALASDRLPLGAGAVALGIGGAGLVQLVPAALRVEHHDQGATVAIGEANAVASAGSVLAPLLIGAALTAGLGWQIGFAALPVLVAIGLLGLLSMLARGTTRVTAANDPTTASDPRTRRTGFPGWWLTIVLAVAAEFCVLLWATDFLRTSRALPAELATLCATGFMLGMAVGRTLVGPALRVAGSSVRLLTAATVLALAGFGLFWAVPIAAISAIGLLANGLGVALLYPVALAQALAAWPAEPVRAAARCALASGVAIGSAPILLGVLGDTVGIDTAFLLVPALLSLLLFRLIGPWVGRVSTAVDRCG